MITLLALVLIGLTVLAAGEAVRGQCRRMLARPIAVPVPVRVEASVGSNRPS